MKYLLMRVLTDSTFILVVSQRLERSSSFSLAHMQPCPHAFALCIIMASATYTIHTLENAIFTYCFSVELTSGVLTLKQSHETHQIYVIIKAHRKVRTTCNMKKSFKEQVVKLFDEIGVKAVANQLESLTILFHLEKSAKKIWSRYLCWQWP